jgi:predicted nucleotidyltransferase
MKPITNPKELARNAAREFAACYGDACVSVILFGSAAGGDFNPKQSDINLLIVLRELSLAEAARSSHVRKKILSSRFAPPLFVDEDYVGRSLDTFPIEFFNMCGCYEVLHGKDVFAGLNIEDHHLRLQLERELKGKWLHLIQGWLDTQDSPRRLRELILVSLRDFSALFRALLRLKNEPVPRDRTGLYTAVGKAYGLEGAPFQSVFSAAAKKDRYAMKTAFYGYSKAIRKLVEIIDHMTSKEDA